MKPIVVFYLNADKISVQAVHEGMKRAQEMFELDEDIKAYVLPVYNQPTKVECINPILATEEEYMVICKKLTEYTDKLMEKMNEKETK